MATQSFCDGAPLNRVCGRGVSVYLVALCDSMISHGIMKAKTHGMAPKEIAVGVYYLSIHGSNVYFVRSGSSWVLIDMAWFNNDGYLIQSAAESLFGLNTRPTSILLTHSHPDHDGSAVELATRWDVSVYVHPKELPLAVGDYSAISACANPLDRWLVLPLLRIVGKKRRALMVLTSSLRDVARSFEPGSGVPGLSDWECIPIPGHTPGHIAFFRRGDGVLIAGDAVLTAPWGGLLPYKQKISMPPYISSWNWAEAKHSIVVLSKLRPYVLATGHGVPMVGPETSSKLQELANRCRLTMDVKENRERGV